MNDILASIACSVKQYGLNRHYLVAYSGGVDSHVLLHACAELKKQLPEFSFSAIHVNHQIHPNAQQWVEHCQAVCKAFSVSLMVETIQVVAKQGESLEAVARECRYQAIQNHMANNGILLTAQHRDDQAETFLLQLLRGAGVKGLASMPVQATFGLGLLHRPLLTYSREEILSYANHHQLKWVHDDSNDDVSLRRNFVRHEVLPRLKKHWPSAVQTISRSAKHCADASDLLDNMISEHLQTCSKNKELVISSLVKYDERMQAMILRQWIQVNKFPLPSQKKLKTIMCSVLHAKPEAMPSVAWKDCVVRRYRDELYIMSNYVFIPEKDIYQWHYPDPLTIGGVVFDEALMQYHGVNIQAGDKVEVRFRQEGQRCKLMGREGTRSLKKLFQEWGVPPWERNVAPLVFVNGFLGCVIRPFCFHNLSH